MSRTTKGQKPAGYEYWSRRPGRTMPAPGAFPKRVTVRAERREAANEVEAGLEDVPSWADRMWEAFIEGDAADAASAVRRYWRNGRPSAPPPPLEATPLRVTFADLVAA